MLRLLANRSLWLFLQAFGMGVAVLLAAAAARAAAPDAPAIAINVLIEPDAVMQSQARDLNARLRAVDASGFALDAGHAVHLTVLQCYVRREDLDVVKAVVAALTRESGVNGLELQATALYATAFGGRGMVAVAVDQAPVLARFHAALIKALQPYMLGAADPSAFDPDPGRLPVGAATAAYVRDFVTASAGEHYRPHVTVGIGSPGAAADLAATALVPFAFHVEAVAIYQLGDFGTARRRLWP